MTKAMRDMEEKRELCDGVICVLDARAPAATLNKNLKKVFGEKPTSLPNGRWCKSFPR